MAMDDLSSVIAALEKRLAEHERKGAELRRAINLLYEEKGAAPKYTDVGSAGAPPNAGVALTQIKRDTFYGKKQMTAIREYLEMRRGQGDGPATPREIHEALKAGGYKFETKSDDVALVGLRAVLRKATTVFHKLPGTGTYGLLAWYPNAKPSRGDEDEDDEVRGRSTRSRGAKKTRRSAQRPKALPHLPGPAGNDDGTEESNE